MNNTSFAIWFGPKVNCLKQPIHKVHLVLHIGVRTKQRRMITFVGFVPYHVIKALWRLPLSGSEVHVMHIIT
jgi:hypothetical protein